MYNVKKKKSKLDTYYKNTMIVVVDLLKLKFDNSITLLSYSTKEQQYTYIRNTDENEYLFLFRILKKLFTSKFSNHTIYIHDVNGVVIHKILTTLISKMNLQIKDMIERDGIIMYIKLNDIIGNEFLIKNTYFLLPNKRYEMIQSFIGDLLKFYLIDKSLIKRKRDLVNSIFLSNTSFRYIYYIRLLNLLMYSIIIYIYTTIQRSFNLNITKDFSITSLAFNIFKKKFLNKKKKGLDRDTVKYEAIIRQAYAGGSVEVYKPYGKNLYMYDCNSLYPYCMSISDMPVGKPSFTIDIDLNKFFGFCYANVHCPDSIEIPFLFCRYKDRLIHPTGQWSGLYFSEELKYAESLGYIIKPIYGYVYHRDNTLFKDFVSHFYNKKVNTKSNSLRFLYKLILNSLYGRFGYNYLKNKTTITTDEYEVQKLLEIYSFYSYQEIGEFKIIKHSFYPDKSHMEKLGLISKYYRIMDDIRSSNKFNILSTSIALSAAITAYSRIFMYKFKTLKDNQCYYSDTDSIVLKKPLNPIYIGNKIGQFKNILQDDRYSIETDKEYKIKEALFFAPKTYALRSYNNKEHIYLSGIEKNTFNFNDLISSYFNINFPLYNCSLFFEKIYKYSYPLTIKRRKVYNREGLWVKTLPIHIYKS